MSIRYNGCDDYGFLTCRPVDLRDATTNLACHQNAESGPTFVSAPLDPPLPTEHENFKHEEVERRTRKKSWWKWMFSSGKHKKKQRVDEGKVRLARHKSDAGPANRLLSTKSCTEDESGAKFNRGSTFQPEDSVIVVDERSLDEAKDSPIKVDINELHERVKLRAGVRKTVSFSDLPPLLKHKSASVDCIESLRHRQPVQTKPPAFHKPTGDKLFTETQPHLADDKASTKETSAAPQKVTNAPKSVKKPQKPERNKSKRERAKKKKTSSSADDLLDVALENNTQQSSLQRSRSMMSFKGLFARKSKSGNKKRTGSTNMDLLLHAEINKACDSTKDEGGDKQDEINVYERYPRRKSEQRKVLVHIQTKEEIPVENGVPQWDSASYQYSSVSGRSASTLRREPHRMKSNPNLIESSFVGTSKQPSQKSPLTSNQSDDPTVSTKEEKKPINIVSLENEPKNLELERRRRTKSDGMLIDIFHKELNLPQTMKENADTPKGDKPAFHAKSASCCEDLLFGRTFALTGVATDKIPDVIARNYPYISTSSPVRHMAQCLRLATAMPQKKTSPNRKILFEDPTTDTKVSPKRLESASNPTAQHSHEISITAGSHETPEVEVKATPTKQVKASPYQPRRCFSDSDLSSIHLSPMKVNEIYQEDDKANTSRRVSRSRSARTDRLLHRMRARIMRLEKLSDLASNTQPKQELATEFSNAEASKVKESTGEPKALSDSCEPRQPSTDKRVSTLASITLKSDASSISNAQTSTRKFHRLIKSRVQSHPDVVGKQTRVAGLQHIQKSLRTRNKESKQIATKLDYENLWPEETSPCVTKKNEEENSDELIQPNAKIGAKKLFRDVDVVERKLQNVQNHSQPFKIKENRVDATQLSAERTNVYPAASSAKVGDDVIGKHDIFLSSTPVKDYARHADSANKAAKSENFDVYPTLMDRDESHVTCSDTPFENSDSRATPCNDLSPNPSVLPSASDFFLRSLLQHQDEIKRTMLQEMQKISHKYSASVASEAPTVARQTETVATQRHADVDGDQSSESDSTSQSTVTWGKECDSLSSGDTITNLCDAEDGYVTMSSNDSTAAQCGSVISSEDFTPWSQRGERSSLAPKRLTAVEYVIPFRRGDFVEEASDFMEWDCDETDL